MPKQKIQIAVPATLKFSSMIRHVSDEIFGFVKFSKAWSSRLKLVLDELFMNAVKYGSMENTSVVHITFEYDETEVTFIIEDDGTGPKGVSIEELKKIVAENQANKDLTKTSGRGLSMIAGLWTDNIEVGQSEFGGVKVMCTKKIDSSVPPPPPGLIVPQDIPAVTPTAAPAAPAKEAAPKETPKPAGGKSIEVKLAGEIDNSNIDEKAAPVDSQIKELPAGSNVVLDFAEVSYINSTFIGHMASWHNVLKAKQSTLQLKNVNQEIKEIITLVGLDQVLNLT